MLKPTERGLLLAICGVVLLSPDALLLRLAETERHNLMFWRCLFAAIGFYLLYRLTRKPITPSSKKTKHDWVMALLYAANSYCFVSAISLTSVANALLIMSAGPLFAAMLSAIFLNEKAALRTWLAALMASLGIGIIVSGSELDSHMQGDLLALISALCLAAIFVRSRGLQSQSETAMASGCLMVALVVLPWANPWQLETMSYVYLILLGLVIVPVSFFLLTRAPHYIPAAEVSLIMLLEAILAPLWVWMVYAELPSNMTYFGGAILLLTLAGHAYLSLRKPLQQQNN